MKTMDETTLTDRQRETLTLLRDGKNTKEVGEALGISYNAANTHVNALKQKGFITKKGAVRQEPSRNGSTTVTASRARVGEAIIERLREAEAEAVKVGAEITEEVVALSQRQHELAEEAERVERIKDGIHDQIATLA